MLSTTFICRFRSNNNKYMVGLLWGPHGMEFPVINNVTNEQLASVRIVCKFEYSGKAVQVIDARKQIPVWVEKAISTDPYNLPAAEFVGYVKDQNMPDITRSLVEGTSDEFEKLKFPSFYEWLCGTKGSWSGAAQLVVNVNEDGGEEDKCPICWGNGCDWKLHCTHVFHLDCLKMWENNGRDTCPYCRRIARF